MVKDLFACCMAIVVTINSPLLSYLISKFIHHINTRDRLEDWGGGGGGAHAAGCCQPFVIVDVDLLDRIHGRLLVHCSFQGSTANDKLS